MEPRNEWGCKVTRISLRPQLARAVRLFRVSRGYAVVGEIDEKLLLVTSTIPQLGAFIVLAFPFHWIIPRHGPNPTVVAGAPQDAPPKRQMAPGDTAVGSRPGLGRLAVYDTGGSRQATNYDGLSYRNQSMGRC